MNGSVYFLNILKDLKRYKLCCLESGHRRNLISRDVVFNEVKFPFKKTDSSKGEEVDDKTSFGVELGEGSLRQQIGDGADQVVKVGPVEGVGQRWLNQ